MSDRESDSWAVTVRPGTLSSGPFGSNGGLGWAGAGWPAGAGRAAARGGAGGTLKDIVNNTWE